MITTLYHEVFGEAEQPTEENSNKLLQAIAFLPDNLASVIIHHYLWKQTIEQVAIEVKHSVAGAERWRQSAIEILKIWMEVDEINS